MLYIEELYNFFETEHNETLDYIDDMYIFLHIHRLIQEDVDKSIIKKEMELLESGVYKKMKKFNITINTLEELLKKHTDEKKELQEKINKDLEKYKKNINDLISIKNDINHLSDSNLIDDNLIEYNLLENEYELNILVEKEDLWWDWLSKKNVYNIINKKDKKDNDLFNIVQDIFNYLNIVNIINKLNECTNKLIIYDIKNYEKKYLKDYPLILLRNCCIFINTKLNKYYNNHFDTLDNINNFSFIEVVNYLIMNDNLYNINSDKNIVIYHIVEDLHLFCKLNKMYNVYVTIKILLKEQYDKTQEIELTRKIFNLLTLLYESINELKKNINNKSLIDEELYKKITIDKNVKNNYYIFVNYLNNIIYLIFNSHFDTKLNPKTTTYKSLEKKYNHLQENIEIYKNKLI